MNKWTGLLFLGGFIATPAALAAVSGEPAVACASANKDCHAAGTGGEVQSPDADHDGVRVEFRH